MQTANSKLVLRSNLDKFNVTLMMVADEMLANKYTHESRHKSHSHQLAVERRNFSEIKSPLELPLS